MDLKSMKRKDLQSLCKQHGIPANATNLGMIESLSAVLQVEEKVEVKRKGCLRGSGGSSGEDLGKKTVTFLLEDGDESDFEFGEKSKRRRMSGVVATGWRRGSEGSESGEGVGVRRTRSRGLGEMVMWSPGVGKKKVVERVEGVRCNVDEVGNEEEAGVTRSLRNPEVVSDKSRKGTVKRKASETGGNVEEGLSRRRFGRNQAKLEENSGDEDGDVGKSKKRGKKDVEVVSDKGVDKEAVMEPTRRLTRTSSNVLDDGLSLDMVRKSVKEKKNLVKDAKVGGGVASVSTRRTTRSSATLVEDVTSLSVVEKPVKECEAIRKSRPLTQGLVSAPKPDVEAEIEPLRRTTRSSSNLVEDATSLAVVEKRVSEGKATKKGKSQKQGKVPASLLNSEVVTEPVRRTMRSSSTLEEDGTSLPSQVTKKVKSQKQGKAAVSLADTEVLIEPIRRTTLNSSTLVEEGIPLVTEVAKKAKSKKQAKLRTLDSGDSITLLPGNESVTEPTRRSTRSSSKSLEGETTSAAVTTPERRSMRSSSKLLEGEVRSVSKQGSEEEGAITYEKRSTQSSSKLLEGETSYVLRQGDKEEAATKSGRRQTRSSLKLSEGDTSFVSKHRDKEEAATTSGKRSTRSSSKLTEVETSPATELGDKQEALTTSGKRSTQSSSKFLEGEANSDTELGNKEEAVLTPERRSTCSSSKLLENVSSVPVLSSDNISVGKDKSGKQATNCALKSGDLKTPLLEAITSTATTRKSMRSSKQQDLTATSPVNEVVSTVTRRATRGSSKALEVVSATSPVIEAVTMPTRRSTPSSLNLSVGEALLEVEKLGDASSASLLDSPTVTESMRRSTRRSSILNMFKSSSVRVEADGGDESVQKKKSGGQTSLLSSGGRATNDSILRSEVERVYGEAQVNSALNKNETTSTTIGENESDTIEMPVEGKEVCMSNIEPTTDAVRNLPEDYEYCPSDLSEVSCKITEEKSSGDCSNVVLSPHSSSETLKLVEIEVENLPTLHLSVGSEENMPMSVIEASVVLGNEGSSEQDIIPDGEDSRYLSEQRDIMSAGLVVDSSPKSIEPEAMKQLNEDTDVTPGITTKVNSDIESKESLELSELVGEVMENMESQETKSRIERHDGISRMKAYEIVLDKFDQSDEVEEEKDYGVGTAENEREATTGLISPSESLALGLIFGDLLKENCAQSSPEMIMDYATTVDFHGNENESDTIEMSVEGRDVSFHDMEPPNVERNLPKDNEYSPSHIAEVSCEITEYKSSGDCRNVIISPHSSNEPLKQVMVDVENFPAVGQSVGPEENMPLGGTETPAMLGNEGSSEQVGMVAAGGEHARHLSAQQIDITNASSDVDSVGNSPKSIEHTAMEQLNEVSDVSPETTTTANFNIGYQRSLALDQVVEENVISNLSSQTAGEMIPPLENSPPALDENVQSFMKIDDEEVVDIKAALEETRNGEEFQSYVSSFPQADLQEGEVTESPTFNKAGFSATTHLANLSPQFDAKSNDENGVVVLSTSKVHTELDVRKGVGKDIAEISSTSKVHTGLDVRKGVRKDIADISPLHCECLSEAKFMIPADASECKEAGKEETYILGSVNLVDKYEEGNTTAAFVSTVQNDNNEDQNKNSDLGSEMDEALPNADQPLVGLQGEIGSCIKQSLSTVVTFQDEKHIDISLSLFDCKTEVDDDATKCWNFCKTKLDFKGFEVTAGSKSIPDIHLTRGGSNSEEANCGDKFESLERTSNVTEAWDEPGASEMFVNELFHMDSEVAGFANDNSQVGQWGCRFHEENFCGDECESFMEVSTNEASATREDDNMLSSSFEDYLRMDYRDSGLVPLEKNLIQEINDDNENEETYSTRQYKLLEQRTSIQEASDVSKLTEDYMVTVSDYSKLDGSLEESIIVDQERVTPYINESKKSEPNKAFLTSQDTLIFSDAATVRSGSTSKIQERENETLENKKYFEDFCWSASDALPDDYLKSATDVNEEQNKTGDIKDGVHSLPSFGISNLNSLIDDGTKNKENIVDLKKGSSFKYIERATVSNSTRQPLQSVRKTID